MQFACSKGKIHKIDFTFRNYFFKKIKILTDEI